MQLYIVFLINHGCLICLICLIRLSDTLPNCSLKDINDLELIDFMLFFENISCVCSIIECLVLLF